MKHAKAKSSNGVLIVLLFLAGLLLFVAPQIIAFVNNQQMNEQVQNVQNVQQLSTGDAAGDTYQAIPQALKDYNESVAQSDHSLDDPFASVSESVELDALPQDLIGSVSIPSMGLELPLYFGATEDHLQQGLAVVAGTSLPLGETNSNCVIAGHRGAISAEMLRYIEKIHAGDLITVTTPWASMCYQATSFAIVDPDDAEAVLVQENKDMITLLTCHPYPTNNQRYLVYAERVPDEMLSSLSAGQNNAEAQDFMSFFNLGPITDSQGQIDVLHLEAWLRLAGCVLIMLFLLLSLGKLIRRIF